MKVDLRLDLTEILVNPESKKEFYLQLDLSQYTHYEEKPIPNPVTVVGKVENHASALVLDATVSSTLEYTCDRCLASFSQEKEVVLHSLVADHLENEENEDIILLQGHFLDMEEVATTAFILEMDTKKLCSEQCRGLCPSCGVNLNEEECRCQAVSDSPFAMLAQLLDD